MMQSKRLELIASFVRKNSIVADIGTDHGIIPMYLSQENISKFIIASDISDNSLEKLREKLAYNPVINNIQVRVSDGLKGYLPFEMDTIIISGMGGLLISQIIDDSLEIAKTANTIIIQANNSLSQLRHFLHDRGFSIVDEKDLFENEKYYQILKVKTGLQSFDHEYEYLLGKFLIEKKSPHLLKHINNEMEVYKDIVSQLETMDTDSAKERIEALRDKIYEMEKVRDIIEA